MRDACPPDEALLQKTSKKRKFKLVVYQRDLSRRIAREEEAVAMMRAALDPQDWDIEVRLNRWIVRCMNKFVLIRMEVGSILIVIKDHSLSLPLLLLHTTTHP